VKNIAIARAAYEAYVTKDRAALEDLVAEDFHFTSPLDNRLDRETYFRRCWPNSKVIEGSTSFISSRMLIACSSPMKDEIRTAIDFATRRFSRYEIGISSMSRCTLAGQCLTKHLWEDS
jgi:hypothetical protein